ncbi:hypothetical protein PG993_013370 [Apiospora rasikravindrae]|uniref:Uncharacterized protein n=1 Tax=Apiospora rasikravindrae TaxID=990691 RepID=A0ABR1RXM1_9PEZI
MDSPSCADQLAKLADQMHQMQVTLTEHGTKIDKRDNQQDASMSDLHGRLETLATQVQEKTSKLDMAANENSRLTDQVRDLERKNQRLQDMVSNLDDTVEELHKAKFEADNIAVAALGELSGARSTVSAIKKEMMAKEAELNQANTELANTLKRANEIAQRVFWGSADQGQSAFVEQKWSLPRPPYPAESTTPKNIFGEPIQPKEQEPDS